MTRDDIIRLFEKANGWSPKGFENTLEDLERFAALVVAHEREQMQERFFCERCGKRLSDGIHTCTPPAEAEKQEPVAWMDSDGNISDNNDYKCFPIPLYTHPPKREWVGLTDEDILDALRPHYEEWEASELLDLSSEDYRSEEHTSELQSH